MFSSIPVRDYSSFFFGPLWAIYEDSFPILERRSLAAQKAAFSRSCYHLHAFTKDSQVIGLAGWWAYPEYRYLEHLAVAPEQRSSGLGSALLRDWMAADDSPVYLEIDQPVDELSCRRLGFYQRLGFVANDLEHGHVSYMDATGFCKLLVLSYPQALTSADYDLFLARLREDAWACTGY